MAALGIFIGTIFAWLTISVDWPGCISMVAIIVFGVATYTQVFQWSLGSWVSTLCIFSFLLGAALESSGWTKRIAAWFITLPMAKQSPWKLIILFFTGALVLAAISPFPAYFVFSFVAKEIFVQAGYKKEDNFPKMMMMGLLVCVQIAQGMVQWTPLGHHTVHNRKPSWRCGKPLCTENFSVWRNSWYPDCSCHNRRISIHFKSRCFKAYEC